MATVQEFIDQQVEAGSSREQVLSILEESGGSVTPDTMSIDVDAFLSGQGAPDGEREMVTQRAPLDEQPPKPDHGFFGISPGDVGKFLWEHSLPGVQARVAKGALGVGAGLLHGISDIVTTPFKVNEHADFVEKKSKEQDRISEEFDFIVNDPGMSKEEKDQLLTPMSKQLDDISDSIAEKQKGLEKDSSVIAGAEMQRDLVKQRLGMSSSAIDNLGKDIQDISAAFPFLMKELSTSGGAAGTQDADDFFQRLNKDFGSKKELARSLMGGAIGANSAVLMGLYSAPGETFKAAPLITILTLVAYLTSLNGLVAAGASGAANLSRIAGLRRLVKAMKKSGAIKEGQLSHLEPALKAHVRKGGVIEGKVAQVIEDVAALPGKAVSAPFKAVGGIELRSVPGVGKIPGIAKAVSDDLVEVGGKPAVKGAVQEFTEGTRAMTIGDVAKASAIGGAVGLLGAAPVEIAVLAPLVRTIYGVGKGHPKFAEHIASIHRFISHTSAQRNVSYTQAVRQTMDDAPRAVNRYRRLISAIAREQAETGGRAFASSHGKWSIEGVPAVRATTPKAQKIMSELEGLKGELKLSDDFLEVFLREMEDISEGGASLLKHPTVAAKVEAILLEGLTDAQLQIWAPRINTRIRDLVKSERNGPPVLRFENEIDMQLMPAIDEVLASLDEADSAALQADVLQNTLARHESTVAIKAKNKALDFEATRDLQRTQAWAAYKAAKTPEEKLQHYVLALAESRVLSGRAVNQVMPSGMAPAEVALKISEMLNDDGKPIMRHLDSVRGRKMSAKEARVAEGVLAHVADEIGQYKPRQFLSTLGDGPEWLTAPQIRQRLDAIDEAGESLAPVGEVEMLRRKQASLEAQGSDAAGRHISPGLASTDAWVNGMQEIWPSTVWISNLIKKGLTTRNVPTHINNYGSNVFLQATRLGVDPFTFIGTANAKAGRYMKWRNGAAKNTTPLEVRKYRNMDEMGLVDTDLTAIELDVGRRGGAGTFVPMSSMDDAGYWGKTKGAWKKVDEAATNAYRWGDEVFKIDEAMRQMDVAYTAIDRLSAGKKLKLRTSDSAVTTVRRGNNGELYIGNTKLTNNGKLTKKGERRLDRAVGASARKAAMDLFVDYGSVPGIIRWLRSMGPLAIASPFLTWAWKAMNPTGKGLLAQSLFPAARFVSDDPALMARQAALQGAANLRRATAINGLVAQMDDKRDHLKEVVSFHPDTPTNFLFAATGDPEVALVDNIDSLNWMGPASAFIEAAAEAVSYLQTDIGADPLNDRQELLARRNQGRGFSSREALKLLGLQGTAVKPLLDLATAGFRERGGRPSADPNATPINGGKLMIRYIMPWITGGTVASATDVVLGTLYDETSPMSSRLDTISADPNLHESTARWIVRKMTGVGFKPVALTGDWDKMDQYVKKIKAELQRSIKQQERQIRRLERTGRAEDEAQIRASYERLYQMEDAMSDEFNKVIDKWEDIRDILLLENAKPLERWDSNDTSDD